MTIDHLILRYAHISMALLGLVSGAAAMTFRKGSPLHRQSGNVFFVSMLIMSSIRSARTKCCPRIAPP